MGRKGVIRADEPGNDVREVGTDREVAEALRRNEDAYGWVLSGEGSRIHAWIGTSCARRCGCRSLCQYPCGDRRRPALRPVKSGGPMTP